MNLVAMLTFAVGATVAILAFAGIWMAIEKALGVQERSSQAVPAGPMRNQDEIDQG